MLILICQDLEEMNGKLIKLIVGCLYSKIFRYNFTPTEEEKSLVLSKMCNNLKVPKNFRPTAVAYQAGSSLKPVQPEAKLNPQTVELCEQLSIDDPICLISEQQGLNISVDVSFFENSTFLEDTDDSSECPDKKAVTPLKLPEPKLDASDCIENVGECSVNDCLLSNQIEERLAMSSDEGSSKRSPKRCMGTEDANKGLSEMSTGPDNNTPTTKKFKRRNASIYNSEENS